MILLKNTNSITYIIVLLFFISCSKDGKNKIDIIDQTNFSQQESIKLDQIAIDLRVNVEDLEDLGYTSNTEINQKSTWNYSNYKEYWDPNTEFSKIFNFCFKGVLNGENKARYRFYGDNSNVGEPIEVTHSNGKTYRIYGIKVIYASSLENGNKGIFDQKRTRWSGKEWYRSWSTLSDVYGYPDDENDIVLHTFYVSKVNSNRTETIKWWTDVKRYSAHINLK